MQGSMPGLCLLEDCTTLIEQDASIVEENVAMLSDFNESILTEDVADLANGYAECMEEAMRYLIEVEHYSADHPAVQALLSHLDQYRKQFLRSAIYRTSVFPS